MARDDGDPLPPRYSRSASNSQPRSAPIAKPARPPSVERHPGCKDSRELFYVKKYVELDDYIKEFKSRRMGNVSVQEKIDLYGSPVAPIFVPLARGESVADHEERFDEWLARKGLTRRELEKSSDRKAERNKWYSFAYENAKGKEKFDPQKSSRKRTRSPDGEDQEPAKKKATRDSTETEARPHDKAETKPHSEKEIKHEAGKPRGCTMVPPPKDVPRTEVIAAYVACGCQRCLLKGIWHMARKVSEVEAKIGNQPKCSCGQPGSVKSVEAEAKTQTIVEDDGRRSPLQSSSSAALPRPSSASRSSSKEAAAITKLILSRPSPAELVAMTASVAVRRDPTAMDEDPVEKQLASEYDDINEQIIMNENVLEASAARLASTPVTDIQETTRLQDENLELRGFVEEEAENRNAALAMLVVYLWRHDRAALEKMISDSGTSDVVHVQRMGHHKCGVLAKQIVEKRDLAATIKRELDATMDSEEDECKRLATMAEFGTKLVATENDVKTLLLQRKREFVTLVHFDDHLRLLIKTLLDTSAAAL